MDQAQAPIQANEPAVRAMPGPLSRTTTRMAARSGGRRAGSPTRHPLRLRSSERTVNSAGTARLQDVGGAPAVFFIPAKTSFTVRIAAD